MIRLFVTLTVVLLTTLGALIWARHARLEEKLEAWRAGRSEPSEPAATPTPSTEPTVTQEAAPAPVPEEDTWKPGTMVADGWVERDAFRTKVAKLVNDRKFAELERLAERLRQGEKQPGGNWWLPEFYEGVLMAGKGRPSEDMWTILTEWQTAFPGSATPAVALGEWWVNQAWEARSGGGGSTGTDEDGKLFESRLERAKEVLHTLSARDASCPEWYSAMLKVGQAQKWKKAEYDRFFSAGVRRWPDYHKYYYQKSTYLLSHWSGKKGDWERFASEAADQWGDALYARIVWSKLDFFGNIFAESEVSWPRVKKGCEEMMRQHPTSSWDVAYACMMAFEAGDYAKVTEWAKRLDGLTVVNGPLTPGMVAFAERMVRDPNRAAPRRIAEWIPDDSECRAVIFVTDSLGVVGTRKGGVFLFDPKGSEPTRLLPEIGQPVSKFALSPDHRLLAICVGSMSDGQPGQVKVYDLQTEKMVAEIEGWAGPVGEAAFNHDGEKLFMVGGPAGRAEAKVWERATGAVEDLPWTKELGEQISAVSTHPHWPLVAVSSAQRIYVWNYETGRQVFQSEPLIQNSPMFIAGKIWPAQVWSVRFSPDGYQLVAGTCPEYTERGNRAGGLTAWDATTFLPQEVSPDDRASGADRVRFSPDGTAILSNDQSAMLFLRDASTRSIRAIFPAGQEYVKDLAFSPNGELAATAGRDRTLVVWDLR